ncbi:MAG: lanthionine synthetase LanC family protein [Gemmatimonas sp.]
MIQVTNGIWRPVLSANDCARSGVVARDLTAAIRAEYLQPSASRWSPWDDYSFSEGSAGIALLFAAMAQFDPDESYVQEALIALAHAVDGFAKSTPKLGFLDGIAGVYWSCRYLYERWPHAFSDHPTSDADVLLHDTLRALATERATFDFTDGLAGLGVYAVSDPRDNVSREIASLIVERLDALAKRDGDGAFWRTHPAHSPPIKLLKHPAGYTELGVATGQAGVVGFLAQCLSSEIAVDRCSRLLHSAVRWLLRHRLPPSNRAAFAETAGSMTSRLAWCTGGLGIAVAIGLAGRVTGSDEWSQLSREVAVTVVQQTDAESRVVDASLCHGSAGVLLALCRLYDMHGAESLREAAQHWWSRTMGFRENEGVGGYRGARLIIEGTVAWKKPRGIQFGAAGVALALLAASTFEEPTWDSALLMSLPRRFARSPQTN